MRTKDNDARASVHLAGVVVVVVELAMSNVTHKQQRKRINCCQLHNLQNEEKKKVLDLVFCRFVYLEHSNNGPVMKQSL